MRRIQMDQAESCMRRAKWQAGKMLVPMLGVLAALSMVVAAIAIVLQMQEREKRQAKERELQEAVIENEELQGRLQETQQAKARLEEEFTRTRGELSKTQEQLVKAVEEQTALSKSVEERQQEINHLTSNLTEARSEAKQISAQLAEIQAERDAMKQQLAELETKLSELSGPSEPTVELEKVLVRDDQAQTRELASVLDAPQGSADGQILVVNREYDFIVMNLGKNHGLSIGQEFQVIRGNQVLGKVKVEKVYDELSAAAILPESQKDNIREGDNVRAL